jgi:hypothetical protein
MVVMELLDDFAANCQKAFGFLAGSFAKGKTPKLSGYAG